MTVEQAHEIWEVRRAVSTLPAEDQQIVRMQHFEGLTHAQIAERLRVPIGTVKSRSFRAHKRLATDLRHLRSEPIRTNEWESPGSNRALSDLVRCKLTPVYLWLNRHA